MHNNPRTFYGDGGINGLASWIREMELALEIHIFPKNCRVKFTTCMFMGATFIWWNTQVKTLGIESAYATSWEALKSSYKKDSTLKRTQGEWK